MQIIIYFGDKPVYLCDELNETLNELIHHPDVVFIDELSSPAIKSLLHEIKKEDFHAGILLHKNFEKLKKDFFKHFTLIIAAGGIIQNDNKDLLFIFRKGKWDLPKGKLEKNESPEACASREIKEETGAKKLIIKHKVGDTYHAYNEFGKNYLKMSQWYYFICPGKQQLNPQTEEDITDARWFSTKDMKKPMSNTYSTIKNIVSEFFDTP